MLNFLTSVGLSVFDNDAVTFDRCLKSVHVYELDHSFLHEVIASLIHGMLDLLMRGLKNNENICLDLHGAAGFD